MLMWFILLLPPGLLVLALCLYATAYWLGVQEDKLRRKGRYSWRRYYQRRAESLCAFCLALGGTLTSLEIVVYLIAKVWLLATSH